MKKEKEKNNDKKNSSKCIFIIIIIILILIIFCIAGFAIWKLLGHRKLGENIVNDISQDLIEKSTNDGNSPDMNNVIITNEGIKANVSEKVAEEKQIENVTIKDMNVSSYKGNTTIVFTIVNNSQETISNKNYKIKFLTNISKEIGTVTGNIENLEAGKESLIYLNSEQDLSNAFEYEFKFLKS